MIERTLEVIATARIIDDSFMTAIFRSAECTQVLIDHIIPEKGFVVQSVHTQHELKNLYGRSVRLDILANDKEGQLCNIEIQRTSEGAVPKRARYNSALLDMNASNAGEDYNRLPPTYVIFLTEQDVLQTGLPLVHIDRIIQETGKPFMDSSHILYVYTKNRDDTPLGRLMQDLYCTNTEDIQNPTLQKEARYYKENEGGQADMCELVRKIYAEEFDALEKAHEEELEAKDKALEALDKAHQEEMEAQKKKQFAASVNAGLSMELIMNIMSISEEEYEILMAEYNEASNIK